MEVKIYSVSMGRKNKTTKSNQNSKTHIVGNTRTKGDSKKEQQKLNREML